MKFLAEKTDGGGKKGKIALCCRVLKVSRQGFYRYLSRRELPWKYQGLAEATRAIHSERTVWRVMKEIGLVHHPKRRPNGITRADREARKSDDLLKRDFSADKPLSFRISCTYFIILFSQEI